MPGNNNASPPTQTGGNTVSLNTTAGNNASGPPGTIQAPSGYNLPPNNSYLKINGVAYQVNSGGILVPASAATTFPQDYANAPDISTFAPGYVAPTQPTTQTSTPAASTQATSGVSTQTPSTAGAAAGAATSNTVAPPTSALQTGNTGPAVKQLQDWLVSQGYMTQDQVNTGYGTYGPQTTAAVAALQQKLGVDNSSGPGDFGPKTLAAVRAMASGQSSTGMSSSGITTAPTASADTSQTSQNGTATTQTPDKYAGLDPVAKQVQMFTDAYNALGLNTIKDQYDSYTKQQADLTNQMNDEIANTTNNPWLSQGVADKTVQRIKDKYATRLDTLTNLLTLTDSLYKQGQAQVETIVSNANADIKATNDLAQKQIDAANALAKDNEVVSTGGRELLVNKETGKTVADLGPTNPPASQNASFNLAPGDTRFDANGKVIASLPAKPDKVSQADQTQEAINQVGQLFTPGATIPGSGGVPFLDSSGNATPQGWNTALSASGIPRATFIKDFGYLIENAGGTVSPKYGLSSVEVRSITGALQ